MLFEQAMHYFIISLMNNIFVIALTKLIQCVIFIITNIKFEIKEINMEKDISNEPLVDMNEIKKILGLKYHTARKYILQDKTLTIVMFGTKKLWLKSEILDFKNRHLMTFTALTI